jgi:hypothetical protein
MGQLVINASIPFGASARIGYRVPSTSAPFVYHSQYPGYNDFPYTIDDVPLGTYEVEITVICPNCSGAMYSEPVVVQAISM